MAELQTDRTKGCSSVHSAGVRRLICSLRHSVTHVSLSAHAGAPTFLMDQMERLGVNIEKLAAAQPVRDRNASSARQTFLWVASSPNMTPPSRRSGQYDSMSSNAAWSAARRTRTHAWRGHLARGGGIHSCAASMKTASAATSQCASTRAPSRLEIGSGAETSECPAALRLRAKV